MFLLTRLKDVKWFEWVLVGAALVFIALFIHTSRKNEELVKSNATLSSTVVTQQEVARVQTQTNAVSDKATASFVTNLRDAQQEQVQARTEVIDEYISLAHKSSAEQFNFEGVGSTLAPIPTRNTTPVAARVKTAPVSASKVSQAKPYRADSGPALTRLAERMQQSYCRANPTAADCAAPSPTS